MQSRDVTINGVTYTIEAWDSEGHGFYPVVHTQDGQPVNIGPYSDAEDTYLTSEEAVEEGRQALRALATVPGYTVGYGVVEERECVYCHALISAAEVEEVPAVTDDAAWARLAQAHGASCEWIATRAHRVDSNA